MSASAGALPTAKPRPASKRFGIIGVEVRGFRTARDVSFSPGSLCALVGEASAGKSNLLAAVRAAGAPVTSAHAAEGGDGQLSVSVTLAGGREAALEASPGHETVFQHDAAPPVLFLSAEARAGTVLVGRSTSGDRAGDAVKISERDCA